MIETFPKGGKKPGTRVRAQSERLGDPYRFRMTMGRSDDEQYRNRMNDYGKTAATEERVTSGMMVSPRRTMISV